MRIHSRDQHESNHSVNPYQLTINVTMFVFIDSLSLGYPLLGFIVATLLRNRSSHSLARNVYYPLWPTAYASVIMFREYTVEATSVVITGFFFVLSPVF